MRIPSFVPLVETERRRREWVGLVVEAALWGYAVLALVRVVWFRLIMKKIEDLAYNEPPVAWAEGLIKTLGFDSRDYTMPWPTLFTLFIGGIFLGTGIGLTGRGFGSWIASISKLQVNNPEDSIRIHKHWSWARLEGWFFLAVTFVTGWVITKIDLFRLFEPDGLSGAGKLALQLSCGIPGIGATVGGVSLYGAFQSLINGAFSIVNWAGGAVPLLSESCIPTSLGYFGFALEKLVESIYLAFMATAFSLPIAFVLSFLAARNLTRHSAFIRAAYSLIRMYINISRSIEPLIWAILFSVWIGIGPFAGSIALMVHSISSLVKQYSEAVESVDPGPMEALQATGASRIATIWFAVVPQVVLPYLSFTIYRWDINVRMATVIGLVGGGGIGGILVQEQGLANWPAVGSIAFLIFIVVWGMDFLSAKIREAIQ